MMRWTMVLLWEGGREGGERTKAGKVREGMFVVVHSPSFSTTVLLFLLQLLHVR